MDKNIFRKRNVEKIVYIFFGGDFLRVIKEIIFKKKVF